MIFSERSRYKGTCTCVSPDGYIDVKVGCEGSEVVSTSPFSFVFVKCGRVTDYMFVEIYYRALKCVLTDLLNGFYCPGEAGWLGCVDLCGEYLCNIFSVKDFVMEVTSDDDCVV